MSRHLVPVDGADLHDGDTFVDGPTGEHTIARLTPYAGGTRGDGMRRACCTDGTCWTIRDHAHLLLLAA